jgi:hypothetical protein
MPALLKGNYRRVTAGSQTMWLRHKPVGAAAGFRGKGRLRAILFVAAQSASHGELRTILPAATEQHTLQRRS